MTRPSSAPGHRDVTVGDNWTHTESSEEETEQKVIDHGDGLQVRPVE